ncbi:MAG: hypothetical protein J1F12_01670 [Muribaculaceae bacterium]|nr:hypothetical protein [Muribaculaceae bacterium]
MIELPVSKSIGARYMVATYFAGTLPADPFFEDNDDLMVLQEALLEVYSDEEPIDYGDSPIDVGASGTALRFVTAVCASSKGADYVIGGTPRLMERPMLPLIELLRKAGADIQALGENNTGPYRVKGNKLEGGDFEIRGDISSQFISALMLVAPTWENGLNLKFSTPTVSKPYLKMTQQLMEKFGITVELDNETVKVPHAPYIQPQNFTVEADWSSASFFYEACAISGQPIEIANLAEPSDSLQGDAVCASLFELLGVYSSFNSKSASISRKEETGKSITLDFKDSPDLLLPFAVASLCRGCHFRFNGVAHLRLKESDRLKSLYEEALKLGWKVTIEEDSIFWEGETVDKVTDPVIDPHDDHRVAMAFAMIAFKTGEIRIANPRVVEKSFINFWNQIEQIGLSCSETDNIMIVRK